MLAEVILYEDGEHASLFLKKVEFDLAANPTQDDLESFLGKGAATGGFFLMEGSIETRNRFFGRFGSALFLDYGNTWNSSKEFRFDGVAVAAGFGLSYYSDFAPFRIDFGLKVYDPNDRRPMVAKTVLERCLAVSYWNWRRLFFFIFFFFFNFFFNF